LLLCQLAKTPGKLEFGKVVLFKVYNVLVQLVLVNGRESVPVSSEETSVDIIHQP
jgi:hypothetical protein